MKGLKRKFARRVHDGDGSARWTYDNDALLDERLQKLDDKTCEICAQSFKELVKGATGAWANICPKCLVHAERIAAEGKVTIFVVLDEMKRQLEEERAKSPERLPCVCCGDNLITVMPDGTQTYIVEEGRPVFVCAKCDAAAEKVADESYGALADAEEEHDGEAADERLRAKFNVLAQMALLGYLGTSRKGPA